MRLQYRKPMPENLMMYFLVNSSRRSCLHIIPDNAQDRECRVFTSDLSLNSEEDLEWILNESKETKQDHISLHPINSNPLIRHQKGKEEEEKEKEVKEEEDKEQEEEEMGGERLLDVVTEELSNEDIENELTNLQRRVSVASGVGF